MFGLFRKKALPGRELENTEEILLYCPSCGGEYREGFERCAACDVKLVPGGSAEGKAHGTKTTIRKMVPISSGDELAAVKRSGMVEIKSLQRLLAASGIDSLVTGVDSSDCAKSCCRSAAFDLNVRREDFIAAAEVVEREFCRSTGLTARDVSEQAEAVYDQRLVRVSCPACGSEFATSEKTCPHCGLCFNP